MATHSDALDWGNLRAQIPLLVLRRRAVRSKHHAGPLIESLEKRVLLSGANSISGTFFYDTNADGLRDNNEPASPYWLVYIDANHNHVHDANETEVRADANGHYTFTGLADGTYDLRPDTAAGWTQTSPRYPGDDYVTVSGGQTALSQDFGEFHGTVPGSISGNYFLDVNGDGIRESSEPATPYWLAYIDANNNGVHDAGEPEVRADANGIYTFTGLAAGLYTIRSEQAPGWTQTTPPTNSGVYTVAINSLDHATGPTFGMMHGTPPRTGSISGFYFYDTNGNGVDDSGEPRSPYWLVYLDTNDNGIHDANETEVRADANGNFTFTGLGTGSYIVRSEQAPGWTQTYPTFNNAQFVDVHSGFNTGSVDFGVLKGTPPPPTASISGTYFYDTNGDGQRDNGETTSPYWLVYIDANNNGVHDPGETEVRADANGNFTFTGLTAGTYRIRSEQATGWTQTFPIRGLDRVVVLDASHNVTGVDFGVVRGAPPVQQGASLAGTIFNDANANQIWDSGESTLSSWSIYLETFSGDSDSNDRSIGYLARSDANGRYSFDHLLAGTYAVQAAPVNGWQQTFPRGKGGSDYIVGVAAGDSLTNLNFGEHQIS